MHDSLAAREAGKTGQVSGSGLTRRRASTSRIRCDVHRRAGQGDGGCIKVQASLLAMIEMLEEGSLAATFSRFRQAAATTTPHAVLLLRFILVACLRKASIPINPIRSLHPPRARSPSHALSLIAAPALILGSPTYTYVVRSVTAHAG